MEDKLKNSIYGKDFIATRDDIEERWTISRKVDPRGEIECDIYDYDYIGYGINQELLSPCDFIIIDMDKLEQLKSCVEFLTRREEVEE